MAISHVYSRKEQLGTRMVDNGKEKELVRLQRGKG